VTSSPGGIDCGSDCSEAYLEGTTVTLTPAVEAGSTFSGWSGDADCADGSVTLSAERQCEARFDVQVDLPFTDGFESGDTSAWAHAKED